MIVASKKAWSDTHPGSGPIDLSPEWLPALRHCSDVLLHPPSASEPQKMQREAVLDFLQTVLPRLIPHPVSRTELGSLILLNTNIMQSALLPDDVGRLVSLLCSTTGAWASSLVAEGSAEAFEYLQALLGMVQMFVAHGDAKFLKSGEAVCCQVMAIHSELPVGHIMKEKLEQWLQSCLSTAATSVAYRSETGLSATDRDVRNAVRNLLRSGKKRDRLSKE